MGYDNPTEYSTDKKDVYICDMTLTPLIVTVTYKIKSEGSNPSIAVVSTSSADGRGFVKESFRTD